MPKIHVPPALHTHDPDTSEKHISNTNLFLKNLAQNISNPPSQIIRDAIVTCQPEYRNYMPTKEAQIKKFRVRKFYLKEPDSIEDIDIPESLRYLEDELFVLSEKGFRGEMNNE